MTLREIALAAARQVQVEYQSLGPVVVDIEKGMEDPLNIAPMLPAAWEYGDVDAAMASAAKVVQGRFKMGSQYHFHMEVGFSNLQIAEANNSPVSDPNCYRHPC